MGIFSTLFSRRTLSLLTPQPLKIPSRPTSSQPAPTPTPAGPTKKPLHALFTQALGLSQKPTSDDDEEEDETSSETVTEIKNNLKQLEQQIKTFKASTKEVTLKSEKKQKMSLYAAFTNKQREPKPKKESLAAAKKLSPDVAVFAQYLFEKGYFNDANFVKGRKNFDPDWFSNVFSVGYVKFAAHKFAIDHRKIAKWLTGSALKQVAMFGCPNLHRSGVFPAKRLRKFFEVPENTVCSGCPLQQSCKFANQSVLKCDDNNNLDLVTVMKVITPYVLESVHPQLVVPDEVKKSVSQLLKEVVKLSQTT